MKKVSIQIAALALAVLCQSAFAQQSHTIYLVRHAEATSAAPTAALTPNGAKRAECLARTLLDGGIKQIFDTDVKRTQETAAPLAAYLKVTPSMIASQDVSTLVRDLLYGNGGNVLVVGSSDTLPLLIQRMQAGKVPAISDSEFDRLFVVTVTEGAATSVATLRYCQSGAPASSVLSASKRNP